MLYMQRVAKAKAAAETKAKQNFCLSSSAGWKLLTDLAEICRPTRPKPQCLPTSGDLFWLAKIVKLIYITITAWHGDVAPTFSAPFHPTNPFFTHPFGPNQTSHWVILWSLGRTIHIHTYISIVCCCSHAVPFRLSLHRTPPLVAPPAGTCGTDILFRLLCIFNFSLFSNRQLRAIVVTEKENIRFTNMCYKTILFNWNILKCKPTYQIEM